MEGEHTLYALENYTISTGDIPRLAINYSIEDAEYSLDFDDGLHMRIEPNKPCILYFDLDGYKWELDTFIDNLNEIYKEQFNIDLDITMNDVSYSQGTDDNTSYHISIPKYYTKPAYINKYFIEPLLKKYNDIYIENGHKILDGSIYSVKWWKMPNQSIMKRDKNGSKELIKRKPQQIINGVNRDFIITYIPDNATLLDKELTPLLSPPPTPSTTCKKQTQIKVINNDNDDNDDNYKKDYICKIIDCLDVETRIMPYDDWVKLAFIFMNSFDEDKAYEYFKYASKKCDNYDGDAMNKQFFDNIKSKRNGKKLTLGSLIYYAMEDNMEIAEQILFENRLSDYFCIRDPKDINETIVCRLIADFDKDKFIYQNEKLYCFNGRYWETYDPKKTATILHTYLKDEFGKLVLEKYKFLINEEKFIDGKSSIDIYRNICKRFIKFCEFDKNRSAVQKTLILFVENKSVKFDYQPNLLAFENKIWNLEKKEFVKHDMKYYLTDKSVLNYDWREPEKDELEKMETVLDNIFPNRTNDEIDTHNSFIHFLSRCLDGYNLEKFIILTGDGGNGKGLITDLMSVVLGTKYAFKYQSAVLTSVAKSGANPEIASMYGKRFCYASEPPSKTPLQNSIIKEITGGGKYNGRMLYSNECEGEISAKVILECNDTPTLAEGAGGNDISRRLVVYKFKMTFTNDIYHMQDNPNRREADPILKTKEFQESHKFAFLRILFNSYNRNTVNISNEMKEYIKCYLDKSNSIGSWFRNNYVNMFDVNNDLVRAKTLKDFIDNLNENDKGKLLKNDYDIDGLLQLNNLYDDFISSNDYIDADKIIKKKEFIAGLKKTFCIHCIDSPVYIKITDKNNKEVRKQYNNVIFGYIKKIKEE